MLRPINVSSQLGRVIAIMRDGKRRTLREIERECWTRYGHADTQTAISARLRQVHRYGYRKQAHIEKINDKAVWWYYLTPMDSTKEQAA
ncbi:hypothetical protein [Pseudaeromonas pectinilytica]